MKLDSVRNTKKNIVWGVANKFISILCPFIIRSIIIHKLGIEYVGLNSLFTSILSTLSIAELGFDTAIVTIMYQGVATDDYLRLSALYNFIKRAYLIVGIIILGMGVLLIPFIPFFIKDINSLPSDIKIYHIYIIFLINTVVSYLFGGYSKSLFEAYQRQDIIDKINIIESIIFYAIEILLLLIAKNYMLYIYTIVLGSITLNIIIKYVAKRKYDIIEPDGFMSKEDKESLKKIVIGTLFGKIGSVLSISFDNVVISSLIGITVLGYYSNYYYIVSSIQGFLALIYISAQAGIGNSLVIKSEKENFDNLMTFTFIFNWLVGWSSTCLLVLLTPFIRLWMGEEGVLPFGIVLLLVLNFYLLMCGSAQGTYKNALGIWWEDRYRTIVSGITNLALNIALVKALLFFGCEIALCGVILSTLITNLFIGTPWSIKVTFDKFYKQGQKYYVSTMIKYFLVNSCVCFVCYCVSHMLDLILGGQLVIIFVGKVIICMLLPNVIYYMIYRKTNSFMALKSIIK